MKRGTSSSSYDTPASPKNPINKQRIRVKGQEYVWLDEIKAETYPSKKRIDDSKETDLCIENLNNWITLFFICEG